MNQHLCTAKTQNQTPAQPVRTAAHAREPAPHRTLASCSRYTLRGLDRGELSSRRAYRAQSACRRRSDSFERVKDLACQIFALNKAFLFLFRALAVRVTARATSPLLYVMIFVGMRSCLVKMDCPLFLQSSYGSEIQYHQCKMFAY